MHTMSKSWTWSSSSHLRLAIVSKWRTINDILPRISASHKAVRSFVQVLIFSSVAPSTFVV